MRPRGELLRMATLDYEELIETLRRGEHAAAATIDRPERSDAPAPCGPDCYEVEPGKLIHRLWTGQCRANLEYQPLRQVERDCWHCYGGQLCGCIACAEKLAPGARGHCGVCGGSWKVMPWLQ
jgi:hypothetical protein